MHPWQRQIVTDCFRYFAESGNQNTPGPPVVVAFLSSRNNTDQKYQERTECAR